MPPSSQCTPDVDSSAVLSTENKRVKEPVQNSICDETNSTYAGHCPLVSDGHFPHRLYHHRGSLDSCSNSWSPTSPQSTTHLLWRKVEVLVTPCTVTTLASATDEPTVWSVWGELPTHELWPLAWMTYWQLVVAMTSTKVGESHPSPIHFSQLHRGRGPASIYLPRLGSTPRRNADPHICPGGLLTDHSCWLPAALDAPEVFRRDSTVPITGLSDTQ